MKDVGNHIAAWQVAAVRVAAEPLQGNKASVAHGHYGEFVYGL